MALQHVLGADHVVVAVRDLKAAAERWERLGFTVSPLGTHSPLLGTGNHTIMFDEDYVELIGILSDTEQNQPTREFLAVREGVERTAFTTDDAAAGAAELKSRGLAALGPIHFGRPVELPDGRHGEARFNVFRWPLGEQPGGMRIFACQHLTRELVWIPELQKHANGAHRVVDVEILCPSPRAASEHLARLIDQAAVPAGDAWRVASGGHRADFLFYDEASFQARYPGPLRAGAASYGVAALVIGTNDLAGADKSIANAGVRHGKAVSVPAPAANGVILSFVEA